MLLGKEMSEMQGDWKNKGGMKLDEYKMSDPFKDTPSVTLGDFLRVEAENIAMKQIIILALRNLGGSMATTNKELASINWNSFSFKAEDDPVSGTRTLKLIDLNKEEK